MDSKAWDRAQKNRKFLTKKGRQSLYEEEMERRRRRRSQEQDLDLKDDGKEEASTQNQQQPQSGINKPLLRKLQVSNEAPRLENSGTFNILVVLVQWENHASRMGKVPQSSYDYLFNGQGRDELLAPYGTVRDWFDEMSHGELQITAYVSDWIVATGYTEQSFTGDNSQGRTQELQEAFAPVMETLDNMGVDFGQFDADFDRNIDMTVFVHSGYDGLLAAADCDNNIPGSQRIASHARWAADESTWFSRAGYGLGSYAVVPAFRGTCDTQINRIGLIVHEMIHPFAIPDLYDIEGPMEGATSGLGGIDSFDTMANAQGQSSDLALPGSLSVWTKYKLGWVTPTPITADGSYTLRAAEEFPDAFIINEGFQLQEYLLIENRQPKPGTFDEKFYEGGGVTVYHIDENIWTVFSLGGNEGNYPRGGPFLGAAWPGNNYHYPVALLQADGLYELEQALNAGHAADLYNSASQILGPGNGNTYPNTDSYAFGVVQSTGITLSNFQADGTSITFDVSGLGGSGGGGGGNAPEPTAAPPTDPSPSPIAAPTAAPAIPATPSPGESPQVAPVPSSAPCHLVLSLSLVTTIIITYISL
jgi:M6 family metalloprotease-like protein